MPLFRYSRHQLRFTLHLFISILSPPTALRQGVARAAFDLVVHVVSVPIQSLTARGPQTGYCAGGIRPRSRCNVCTNPILPSPPTALRQGIAWEVVDLEVADNVFCYHSPPAALRQGVARAVFDLVVDMYNVCSIPILHPPRPSDRVSPGR
jgi:hypothetical protein